MAQSSNYKQYNRSTRVLTEETGFAGGMLWTGNNIDETHLRAAVNFDYDDTTGYLKTRPGFTAYEHSPTDYDLEQLNIDLTGCTLLGAYNICPITTTGVNSTEDDEELLDAGWLYIFADPKTCDAGWKVHFMPDDVVALFRDANQLWHLCNVDGLKQYITDESGANGFYTDVTLQNIDKRHLLTAYDNVLYGIGPNSVSGEYNWFHVYRLTMSVGDGHFGLEAIPYSKIAQKFDTVTLTEACVTGFNAARGAQAFTYSGKQVDDAGDIAIQGAYLTDDKGTIVISPTPGVTYNLNVIVNYQSKFGYVSLFEFKSTSDTVAADTSSVWAHRKTIQCYQEPPAGDGLPGQYHQGLFTFKHTFNTKKTTLMFTYYKTNPQYEALVKQPEDWGTNYRRYYTATQLYTPVKPKDVPWKENTYYKKDAKVFTLLTAKPTDWGTATYYEPHKVQYESVQSVENTGNTAPSWTTHTYYQEVEPAVYASDALDYFGPYTITASDSSQNLKIKHYHLNTAVGSCVWRNRMCLWGSDGNHNSLFLSDVDNFYYFPIPNNVAVFETNIISCIPYKDTLLIFTADKIYRMSENNDGTFTQTVVQNDMPLSQEDAAQLTAIKNMILFKSGKYFYMIVPKSQSLTDELTIAPIYKNIAGLLNDLDKGARDVLQLMYPEYYFTKCTVAWKGSPTAVYSEQDTVHILYDINAAIRTKEGADKEITYKLFLNYNTNLRAWTLYIEDTTNHSLEVATLTSARLTTFVRIDPNTGAFGIVVKQPSDEGHETFRALIDTGYRTLSSATQKRFREVQLKLYSASENTTAFGTAFLVDGVWRRSYSKLQEYISADNTVSLMPELDLNTLGAEFNTFITELTMPVDSKGEVQKLTDADDDGELESSDSIELSDWTLDFSHFKREAPVTVRIPVSGKGYNPRFIFMTPVTTELSVNEVNWVYRLMHGR